MFDKITLCFDMHGCPNRCRHCWLNVMSNKKIDVERIRSITNEFSVHSEKLEVYTWLREPDYPDNYKDLWKLDNELSKNATPKRFELCSFYRLVRDTKYVEWLKTLDLKTYQLTVFGRETITDEYVGRKGAYREILQATDILLKNGLIPRWQMFVFKDNIDDVNYIINLIKDLDLKNRCNELGEEFKFFIHTGSCCGENYSNYDKWITTEDLNKLPKEYFVSEVKEEGLLYQELINDFSTEDLISNEPVFHISNKLDVFPNISEMSDHWTLGNLNTMSVNEIIEVYKENKSVAQNLRATTSLSDIVISCGEKNSSRLFQKEDYIDYLLNKYCKETFVI